MDQYKAQKRQALIQIITEIPSFTALIISVYMTRSLVVWMDVADACAYLLHAVLIFLLSKKLSSDLKYEYNYGTGKIESAASLCCDFFLIVSILCVAVFSVADILHPKRASDLLPAVMILKSVYIILDIYLLCKQIKIYKKNKSMLFRSEFALALKALVFDAAVFVSLLLSYLFRNYKAGYYISPVCCIVFGVFFLADSLRRFRDNLYEILDKTADEPTQQYILSVLNAHYSEYEKFNSVYTRVSGKKLYVDLDVDFDEGTDYKHISRLSDELCTALSEKYPQCELCIKIEGGGEDGYLQSPA